MTATRTAPTDLRVTRRTTKSFAIAARRYSETTGELLGPLSLTGASIFFTAKRRFEDTDLNAVITKSVGSGITVTAPATNGDGVLTLLPADTDATDAGKITKLVYSLEVVESNGDVTEIAHGGLIVDPKARRA